MLNKDDYGQISSGHMIHLETAKFKCDTAHLSLSLFVLFPATADIVIEVDGLYEMLPSSISPQ